MPVLCERCGQLVTGQPGEFGAFGDGVVLSEDGCHYPTCRMDPARQPPGLLKALLGRHT
ncbi:hypothetical protein [Streptomyces shenzhenensis]|uniref:hypothetical protein n=1 Tax=Streptomyces shenzhenensis TaxID=943815 RepID=UPI0036B5AF0C